LLLVTALGAAAAGAKTAADPRPRVLVAVLPNGTEPEALGSVPGISPGLMSAGLARVGAEQTYLDISQGNRIFSGFYDEELPFLLPFAGSVPHWDEVVRRANSAPAEIVPGLLASTLKRAGVPVQADPDLLTPSLIAADERGRLGQARGFCGVQLDCAAGLTVEAAYVRQLPAMVQRLRTPDLLIAMERAPPASHHGLAIGIAGRGFDGNLVSGSTRLRGMVLATDVAPTILRRFGVGIPDEMLGRAIHSEGEPDPHALNRLDARLARVVPRRETVIGTNIFIWIVAAAIAALSFGGRGTRRALALLGVACMYLPALLLVGAALEPSHFAERLIVGLGCPLLAAATLRLLPGYGAFAAACGVTVGAYAIDMVAGSPLTALSLMGPNPSLGVRFYGIGNELEATLAAMVALGTGAALASLPGWSRRRQAAAFAATAVAATAVFAAGRFGADVGAAIVMPIGGAAAALYALGVRGRRFAAILIVAPIVGLAALVALDLLAGGDSHLSRSVLHAQGSSDLIDIADRRLRSAARSFARPVNGSFLLLAVAGLVAAFFLRRRVAAWFEGREPALAGLLGAVAGTAAGALANDSGALILIIGTGVLTAYACFAWAQAPRPPRDKTHETPRNTTGTIL
jgi:hypothetical protein